MKLSSFRWFYSGSKKVLNDIETVAFGRLERLKRAEKDPIIGEKTFM